MAQSIVAQSIVAQSIKGSTKSYLPLTLIALLITLSTPGCSAEEDDRETKSPSDIIEPFPIVPPTQSLWTERQGIGPDWYTMYLDRETSIVPNHYVYAFEEKGKETTFLQILNYKNDHGDEGYFSFALATGSQKPNVLVAHKNLEDGPLCIRLSEQKFCSCYEKNEPFDLLIAAPRRVILDASYQLRNPSIFTANNNLTTYAIPAVSLNEVNRHGEQWKSSITKALPNVYKNRADSRLHGATTDGLVQVTVNPNFYTSAWIFNDLDAHHASIHLLCSHTLQDYPLKNSKKDVFSLGYLDTNAVYGINFCKKQIEKVNMPHGLFRPDPNAGPDLVPYDAFLYLDSKGSKNLILSPNTVSWAYGKAFNAHSLDKARDLYFYMDVIQFLHPL